MFEYLAQHAELKSSTNVEFLLPKNLGKQLQHADLQGVAFACTTSECEKKHINLAYADAKGPKDAKFNASWTEIKCTECSARYLIGWSASDGDGSMTVQRIE